jgi:hypothetical protein
MLARFPSGAFGQGAATQKLQDIQRDQVPDLMVARGGIEQSSHRHADFQSSDGGSRGLLVNHLQRLRPLSPGPPWHNPGTPNLSWSHSRHMPSETVWGAPAPRMDGRTITLAASNTLAAVVRSNARTHARLQREIRRQDPVPVPGSSWLLRAFRGPQQGEIQPSPPLQIGGGLGENLLRWNRFDDTRVELAAAPLRLLELGLFHAGIGWAVKLLQQRS